MCGRCDVCDISTFETNCRSGLRLAVSIRGEQQKLGHLKHVETFFCAAGVARRGILTCLEGVLTIILRVSSQEWHAKTVSQECFPRVPPREYIPKSVSQEPHDKSGSQECRAKSVSRECFPRVSPRELIPKSVSQEGRAKSVSQERHAKSFMPRASPSRFKCPTSCFSNCHHMS